MHTFIYPHELTGKPKKYIVNKYGMRHIEMIELTSVELKMIAKIYKKLTKDTIEEFAVVLEQRIQSMYKIINERDDILVD
jgi:hypothetical protein